MSPKAVTTVLILAGITLLGALISVYVVSERERAVLLRFGEIVKPDVKPGLHFKVPFIDRLRVFDGRIQTLDVPPGTLLHPGEKSRNC